MALLMTDSRMDAKIARWDVDCNIRRLAIKTAKEEVRELLEHCLKSHRWKKCALCLDQVSRKSSGFPLSVSFTGRPMLLWYSFS